MEAASCGTPAVGYNVAGVRDSIKDGFTGYLAEDEEDFQRKIRFLLKNDDLRKMMQRTCTDWAKLFSWNSTAKIYNTLISSSASSGSLLSDKYYPWDLDLRAEAITSLVASK